MQPWSLVFGGAKAEKSWAAMDPQLRSRISAELEREPRHDLLRPRSRRHLKGKILGRNRRCHWEYRYLPNNDRVYYSVDDARRTVCIEYVGPHP